MITCWIRASYAALCSMCLCCAPSLTCERAALYSLRNLKFLGCFQSQLHVPWDTEGAMSILPCRKPLIMLLEEIKWALIHCPASGSPSTPNVWPLMVEALQKRQARLSVSGTKTILKLTAHSAQCDRAHCWHSQHSAKQLLYTAYYKPFTFSPPSQSLRCQPKRYARVHAMNLQVHTNVYKCLRTF